MEYQVLEMVMFEHPKQWGRRIIKRGNEIMLQTTEDSGKIWTDAPIPDAKLVLPESMLRSASNNPDTGLIIQDTDTLQARSSNDNIEKSAKQEVVESIESGQLLTKTKEDDGLETVTFLGVYSTRGLDVGQVWADGDGYLRIVQ